MIPRESGKSKPDPQNFQTWVLELSMAKRSRKSKPGPPPKHLALEDTWEEAVGKAVRKKRPKDGWPKPEKGQDEKEPEEDSSDS